MPSTKQKKTRKSKKQSTKPTVSQASRQGVSVVVNSYNRKPARKSAAPINPFRGPAIAMAYPYSQPAAIVQPLDSLSDQLRSIQAQLLRALPAEAAGRPAAVPMPVQQSTPSPIAAQTQGFVTPAQSSPALSLAGFDTVGNPLYRPGAAVELASLSPRSSRSSEPRSPIASRSLSSQFMQVDEPFRPPSKADVETFTEVEPVGTVLDRPANAAFVGVEGDPVKPKSGRKHKGMQTDKNPPNPEHRTYLQTRVTSFGTEIYRTQGQARNEALGRS